ncbi:MAG: sporulation initiation factor Spo0A C-terminal domain-containing protein [Firmicutes bacterium]|nr:sporulation initiation factor Spo0A C-terminal domain-containing protein [Bacillota bacterium]
MNIEILSFLLEKKCPTTKGFHYLKSCIAQVKEDPTVITALNKGLYEDVGREHNAEPEAVERCLRTLINLWWQQDELKEYFVERPSARQLILTMTEKFTSRPPTQSQQYSNHDEYVSIYEKLFG